MNEYTPKGTCARKITFEIESNKVVNVDFISGCAGNLLGISKLVEGMDIDEVIKRFDGIGCGPRPTSCPDQFAKALIEYKEKQ